MKPVLKNIAAAFLVSFTGSVPLGYLNLIGFGIYKQYGQVQAIYYLFGILIAEALFLYAIIHLTSRLRFKSNTFKKLEVLSILLLLFLAYWYWPQAETTVAGSATAEKIIVAPLITGLVLNMINFVQVPFWAGWNLYLTANGFATFSGGLKHFFIAGALAGTFTGMLLFIYLLAAVPDSVLSTGAINYLYPLVFLLLAVYQAIKFTRRYFNIASSPR